MPDYINWFVNREKQYQAFQKMIALNTPKRIMLLEAPADMGKTWVLHNMMHYCVQNTIPVVSVNFRNRYPYDYLNLIRRARDQIGPQYFEILNRTIDDVTQLTVNLHAGGASRGGGLTVQDIHQGSSVDLSVGRDYVAGNQYNNPQFFVRADRDIDRRVAELKINDAFFTALKQVLFQTPVAFLFDSFEAAPPEAEAWLREYLLLRMGERQLDGVVVIIAGQKVPSLNSSLRYLLYRPGLAPLTERDVGVYIADRRQLPDLHIPTAFKMSGGNPGLLAKMADLASMTVEDDDGWL